MFERILIDHGDQKTLMTIGKAGILWKLDRVTGKYLDSRQTVFQNIFVKIDPKTGEPHLSQGHHRPEGRSVAALLSGPGRRQGLAGGELSPAR